MHYKWHASLWHGRIEAATAIASLVGGDRASTRHMSCNFITDMLHVSDTHLACHLSLCYAGSTCHVLCRFGMSCVCSARSHSGCSVGLPQGHPELSMPHVSVPDIRWVDWRALRAAGFKGCVFDKDNTLTEPYALEVHEPLAASMRHCMETFEGNIAVLSNSAGLQEFDPKGMTSEY